MRYYKIVITDPTTGAVRRTWTSLQDNGNFNPGALNVELDIPVTAYAVPMGAAYVRIWGISLQDIGRAANFNGANIAVYGGMSKGLPLANPNQAGLLVKGSIQQAFGNWVNTDMTLDLILQPSMGDPVAPKNIVLNWTAGQPLATALASTLATAFPGMQLQISISPSLVLSHDVPGYYQSLTQFAEYVQQVTKDILGGAYPGVSIGVQDNTIYAYDGTQPVGGTSPANPKIISFVDLIGQPTWIDLLTIQAKCVMRADIAVGDYVKMPPSLATTSPQSFSQYRQSSVFQGVFMANLIRHVGNFRQPDANSWVTVINAAEAA